MYELFFSFLTNFLFFFKHALTHYSLTIALTHYKLTHSLLTHYLTHLFPQNRQRILDDMKAASSNNNSNNNTSNSTGSKPHSALPLSTDSMRSLIQLLTVSIQEVIRPSPDPLDPLPTFS